MALASIAVPPDPKRDARARDLAPFVSTWPRHTLKVAWGSFEAGTTFRRATGSKGERYLVNAVACECKDYQQAGQICKHVRAIVLFEAQQAAPAPKPRPSYADIFPKCRTCDDIAESRDGLCYSCGSAEVYRLDRESKRNALVLTGQIAS